MKKRYRELREYINFEYESREEMHEHIKSMSKRGYVIHTYVDYRVITYMRVIE